MLPVPGAVDDMRITVAGTGRPPSDGYPESKPYPGACALDAEIIEAFTVTQGVLLQLNP
jgi:hypothetical protein